MPENSKLKRLTEILDEFASSGKNIDQFTAEKILESEIPKYLTSACAQGMISEYNPKLEGFYIYFKFRGNYYVGRILGGKGSEVEVRPDIMTLEIGGGLDPHPVVDSPSYAHCNVRETLAIRDLVFLDIDKTTNILWRADGLLELTSQAKESILNAYAYLKQKEN